MNEKDFVEIVKREVARYANSNLDKSDCVNITEDDVYIVWMCKMLQNNKAMASTTLFDGMYYEITYNGDRKFAAQAPCFSYAVRGAVSRFY